MENKRTLIAHEAPLSLMPLVKKVTDYDYALVHLFEDSDKEFADKYYKFFEQSLSEGRRVILDNSVFELGTSFNMERFFDWVYKLQPTEYIIPDVLENKEKTLEQARDWFKLVKSKAEQGQVLKSKSIGVCQGKNMEELFQCYKELSKIVNKIGISFDLSCYLNSSAHLSKERAFATGRAGFLCSLQDKIRYGDLKSKPLHLLGCFLPQEYDFYKHNWGTIFPAIETADTSNPVVHGLKEQIYKCPEGLERKEPTKLVDFMKLPIEEITDTQKAAIFANIGMFKTWLI